MVDEGRVARLLRGLTERVTRLTAARDLNPEERSDLWLDGVKYLLITSVETTIDVAQHVVSSESLSAPASNADAIRQIGEHGVIGRDLAESFARAVGFRNVLVHEYIDVDDGIVLAALDQLDDFTSFVTQTSQWILDQH